MAKQEQYIYAVTRIRYRELQLLRDADMEQLLACRDLDAALRYLAERGWTSEGGTVEGLLEAQKRQLWSLLRELVKDLRVFDVFICLNDYHNLKAAENRPYFRTTARISLWTTAPCRWISSGARWQTATIRACPQACATRPGRR